MIQLKGSSPKRHRESILRNREVDGISLTFLKVRSVPINAILLPVPLPFVGLVNKGNQPTNPCDFAQSTQEKEAELFRSIFIIIIIIIIMYYQP